MDNENRGIEDIFDEELKAMGIQFEDETVPKEIPTLECPPQEERKSYNSANCAGNGCTEGYGNAVDASYAPVKNAEASLQNRLLGCAKWALTCGGIAMLMWWFQVNELMAMKAAYPCILACAVLGGFGVGRNAKRGCRYE